MKMRPLSYFRRSVVVFPLAALAALAMFVINEVSYRDATRSFDELGERSAARYHLNELAKSLLNAETGQRGYLLTSRDDYLSPYHDAQEGLHRSIDWLRKYYENDPQTSVLVRQLIATSDEKMSELATTIELHDRGANLAWRDLVRRGLVRQ